MRIPLNRPFHPIEVLVACTIAVLATAALSVALESPPPAAPPLTGDERQVQDDIARLRSTYGPQRHSEYFEEWIVRDFFKDERGGLFVDIGANDYEKLSNTYFLETRLQWSGLAVDPQSQFARGYAEHRPRTKFFPMFVSDHSNDQAKVSIANGDLSKASAVSQAASGPKAETFNAPTITLTDLLDLQKLTKVDFLSIDVELAEPSVLAGFDIDRFRPRLVCIESHEQVRQAILDYFSRHAYTVVSRYLRVDIHNLYFTPLAQ